MTLHFLRCSQIHKWEAISKHTIRRNYGQLFYDNADKLCRRCVNLDEHPLLNDNGKEVPLFAPNKRQIPCRLPLIDYNKPQCGILIDLGNIHALFNLDTQLNGVADDDDEVFSKDATFIQVNAYPLAFLRTAGNFQASSIPQCFLSTLTKINQSVFQDPNQPHSNNLQDSNDDYMAIDQEDNSFHASGTSVVKLVACQFYNYIAYRTATHARQYYSQQGTVTAALAGAFAG